MTIQEQCKLTLPRFEKTAGKVPWCPRSILKSEGLAVCAMADLHGIDLLIESGVCNGRSTEMWCRYFGDNNDIDIFAVDWDVKPEAIHRLRPFWSLHRGGGPRPRITEGDAAILVPELIRNASGRRIGVVIDGPKDDAAVKLAEQCMAYDNVRFVGVHDMAMMQNGTPHVSRMDFEVPVSGMTEWFTDAPWFVELSHHLDADESNLDAEQGTRWTPYCRHEIGKPPMPLGSYGYTIGFLSKETQG